MKKWQNIDRLVPVSAVLALMILWELLCRLFRVESYILPSPTEIFAVFSEKSGLLMTHTAFTLYEAVSGLLLSCVFGILAALLMYRYRFFELAASPLVVISQTVPIIALAPLVMVWFGIGIGPKIGIVVLVCFFPVSLSALSGFKSTEPGMISLLKNDGRE